MYKALGIKGEVSLENFVIWGIFSALGLTFHYYLQSYRLASSSWILSQCSRRSVENLAGALWSLADWDEVGEGKPHRVFVPITETVKGRQKASMCGVDQEVIRDGHGCRAEGSGRTLVNPLSTFLTFCFIGFSLFIHIFFPRKHLRLSCRHDVPLFLNITMCIF